MYLPHTLFLKPLAQENVKELLYKTKITNIFLQLNILLCCFDFLATQIQILKSLIINDYSFYSKNTKQLFQLYQHI